MKQANLNWYATEREEIPSVALGVVQPRGRGSRFFSDVNPNAPAHVGFSDESMGGGYQPPAVIVLRGDSAAETLSWLRVFFRPAFPLSQFARVLSGRDWEMFESPRSDGRITRIDKWASVVVGEILAQSEADVELDAIPLSRTVGCFSAAVARAELIHESQQVTRVCTDRLRLASEDSRFARRLIPVDAFIPVWVTVSAMSDDVGSPLEAAELVLHAAEASAHGLTLVSEPQRALRSYPNLFSDSVEERVVAFHRLANEAMSRSTKEIGLDAALLAAGAILVGRGTSHSFLLRKFPALAPMAFVWFGLMAALLGSKGWDAAWMRAAKGVERQLRLGFSWDDPTAADICWAEYEWVAGAVKGQQAFAEISRQTPRTLSVEIVPGCVCQFRTSAEPKLAESTRRATGSLAEAELRAHVEALNALAIKARQLVDSLHSSGAAGAQAELTLDAKGSQAPSRSKPKRNYKRGQDK